ncbi:23S rRNA (uracil(1939)-C(5))-methyltransferase [Oleiphilus sp. HI0130]|jgi:23S rRNA (uracil1939-C5)-methyltransferase|nr:23S rRNA (uracil(1939)-C(5))-methyltransferase [Oleiphilus sp. HI0118]KZZ72729.1 23S rRNA (uracil(1939)-C(5))-methyltransferase [Oleiphilus sp. HI0130]
MARRRRKKLPQEPIECEISGGLSHEGRGIAKLDGKTQFIDAALPGERVMAQYVEQRGKFDELKTVEVLEASAERVTPPCAAAEICGGCSLQHMDTDAQIQFKEATLRDHFKHFGELEPEEWIAPMTGPTLGYRGKARLGVRYVAKKESVLVGFREKRNSFLADMQQCEVLNPKVGHHLLDLRELVAGLSVYRELPQFEVALGEDAAALVVRHMAPLTEDDTAKLVAFGQAQGFHIYLQPKGVDTVHRIWPESASKDEDRLHYTLDTPDGQSVKLAFHPMDFTQVNAEINKKMVRRALEWLDVKQDERVLDLFCGLGNFTLPLATQAKEVVGVEGDDAMVVRGKENASLNGLDNVRFYGANLQTDFTKEEWAKEGFDKILIDPPRSGALDVCNYLTTFGAKRIVYVSCNPATLARDAGVIVEKGYRLVNAGVMDMFPHTSHVESIALFEKA